MRTFVLEGHTYTAPDKLGAGIIQRYQTATRRRFMQDAPGALEMNARDRHDLYTRWMEEFATSYDNVIAILELVLTPTEGAPAVSAMYDQLQDMDALKAVTDFFTEAAELIMSGPPSLPSTSAVTKASRTTKRK
jgi:carboxylesterase type B